MKDVIKHIETENRTYPIVFNLNVMEEIQEQYGTMSAWGDVVESDGNEPNIKGLKAGLMAMINEGIDIENETKEQKESFVTSKELGRILSEVGVEGVSKIIKDITIESTKTGDESKNE